MENKLIAPRKLQGFWELEPQKEILFEQMQDKIKKVFAQNCFLPLDTPVLELSEILLAKSGGDLDKEIYAFSKGTTNMCMRYDFTVPLARYVSANAGEMEFPFKRFQIGKNYRGEKPQKGRFREFYQCDADIIGDGELSLVADAECIKLYHDCFKTLGYDEVTEISNRNILVGLIEDCDDKERESEIIVLLDKVDKIGKENALSSLVELGVSENNANKYITAVGIQGSFKEVEKQLSSLSSNETFVKGLNELKEVEEYLTAFKTPKENYIFNIGIIRGHNYYTGTVFEVYLKNNRRFGALGGGGRYENLAGYFTDRKLPGVGMSIGLSRLFDLFDQNGLLPQIKKTPIDVFIIPLGGYIKECISICETLRQNGIMAEVAYSNRSFKSKMKEADRREIPFAMIVGENEIKENKFAFKNMNTGTQDMLSVEEIIKKF